MASISPPRALALAAALLALLGLGFFVAAREWQRADKGAEEKGVLADVLSRALSTPATKISIGGIDGALSSDATVRDLKISGRDGVWLTVDRIRIVWRRLALLQRQLDIDQMNVARRPIPADAPVSGEEQPLLPELPLRVDVRQFSLARVDWEARRRVERWARTMPKPNYFPQIPFEWHGCACRACQFPR